MPLARCFNLVLSELFRELVSHYLQEKMLSPDSSYHSRADLPAQKWLSTAKQSGPMQLVTTRALLGPLYAGISQNTSPHRLQPWRQKLL